MKEKANVDNIGRWIEGMNAFNSTPEFGTTRILFTKPEIKNREYVKSQMRNLGLDIHEDAIGNIFACLKGTNSHLTPVWTGSHIDTVPNAGKFDGMAGVVCGMEALRMIKESKESHIRDIMVNVYTSEEPTRYGLSCLGSRAMSGDLTIADTKTLVDMGGKSLYQKLQELDYDIDKFKEIKKEKGSVYATVELHIEQNNRLEKADKPIGVVKKICAPSNYRVQVYGCQSHAGGTDMYERHDAYTAACEMSLCLEKLAKECESEYNTATIGCIEVVPNAVNVIPGKADFSIDIRDCNMDSKQQLIKKLYSEYDRIAKKRGVTYEVTEENNDIPLTCNPKIVHMIEQICEEQEMSYEGMISGPYHDSLFIGRFAPTAMIFVPSKDGISHSPEEYTSYEQLAAGTEILAETLLKLANDNSDLEA